MRTKIDPLKGEREARARLRAFKDKFTAAMTDFTDREAEELVAIIRQEWVPVDQGDLRDSGKSERVKTGKTTKATRVVFGGPKAPYAWLQHENLDFRHRVGSAKFVERPLFRKMSGMSVRLAADVRARAGR